MTKLYWIPYILPYVAGMITYVVLKIFQKNGKLKRFDEYLWSPLALAFSVITLLLMIFLSCREEEIFFLKIILPILMRGESVFDYILMKSLTLILFFIVPYLQLLWIALLFQVLAIIKNKKIYLNIAIFFVLLSILFPIYLEIFIGNIL